MSDKESDLKIGSPQNGEEISPVEWLDAMPAHCRHSRPHPWQDFGKGFVIPSVYQQISGKHLAFLHLQASRLFDDALDQAYNQHQVPRHPSENIFQPAPFLYDALAVWAGLVSFKDMSTEDMREVSTVIAALEIVQSIMSRPQGLTMELVAIASANTICQSIQNIEKTTMEDQDTQ